LGVGLAAQTAVAPILLATFGAIPLFAPVTNLIAAPVVAAATLLAGIGVATSIPFLVDFASFFSGIFMWIGRQAAWLPQLSIVPWSLILGSLYGCWRWPRSRAFVFAALLVTVFVSLTDGRMTPPSIAFLDVGQGDAAVLATSEGNVLIDAGPEPSELWQALRRHGIKKLGLVVLTHLHDDHIAGLVGMAGRIGIGLVWYAGDRHQSSTWETLRAELAKAGIPTQVPALGTSVTMGEVDIEVLGPERHYAGANDESIVLELVGPSVTVLMTGDIEMAAQSDLEPIDIDILKVPHHGAGTSNLSWLLETSPELALISVGENDFGHPAPEVVDAFVAAGIEVRRTDQDGDVTVALGSP
jgi:competence protein ComEC